MHHLTNFWRKTASGKYDDEYARYVDYVGRAHTSRGADPNIYIAERYVIGQVGFIQHAISQALTNELHDIDPDLEVRALRAWNLLMMVILEMLARAYTGEQDQVFGPAGEINQEAVLNLAVETYEMGLGMRRPTGTQEIPVAPVEKIPEGERVIVQTDDLSIGVFHHRNGWYALRNSCIHRGGPVCTGPLVDDTLTCPWHGYQYNLTNGELLIDSSARLTVYPVEIRDGQVYIQVPIVKKGETNLTIFDEPKAEEEMATLQANEFYLHEVLPGQMKLVQFGDDPVTVYNVSGTFFATHNDCTHSGGPLNEGKLEGAQIICPWHDSCFDVKTGDVLCGPATEPVKSYQVVIAGEIGRVVAKTAFLILKDVPEKHGGMHD
jgi:nitrite reductase/ring-hydroxylating ferredoxin subunit